MKKTIKYVVVACIMIAGTGSERTKIRTREFTGDHERTS